MSNLTNALDAATRALGLAPDVITPPHPFDGVAHGRNGSALMGAIYTTHAGLVQAKATLTTLANETVQEGSYFYKRDGKGKADGMPYCPGCVIDEARLERLTDQSGKAVCPSCRRSYGGFYDRGASGNSKYYF